MNTEAIDRGSIKLTIFGTIFKNIPNYIWRYDEARVIGLMIKLAAFGLTKELLGPLCLTMPLSKL